MTPTNLITQYAHHANCDWNLLRAMMSTLSSAELDELSNQADEPIIWRAVDSIMQQRTPTQKTTNPHYSSVKTLLSNYHIKGKKATARKELQTRLPYLSYLEQKQVLIAFLHNCKTDSNWALNYLFNHWDERLEKEVIALFEQNHDNASARIICKWGALEYIYQHLEELSQADSYLHVRLRLPAHAPIAKTRLSDKEYLYLAAKLHIEVPMTEAYNTLINELARIKYDGLIGINGHVRYTSLVDFPNIKHILWCLGELKQFELLQWFTHVNETTRPLIAANDVPAIMKELGL